MLLDGEIDALYAARMPSSFLKGGGKVKRLFEDFEPVARNCFKETGIFPIMHTVALRRDVYEANRWIAQSMMKALVESQRRTYDDLYETAALKTMLPWLPSRNKATLRTRGRGTKDLIDKYQLQQRGENYSEQQIVLSGSFVWHVPQAGWSLVIVRTRVLADFIDYLGRMAQGERMVQRLASR